MFREAIAEKMDWELHLTYCNILYTNCIMCCLDPMNSAKTRWLFICTWRHKVAIHYIYKQVRADHSFSDFPFSLSWKEANVQLYYHPKTTVAISWSRCWCWTAKDTIEMLMTFTWIKIWHTIYAAYCFQKDNLCNNEII